MLARRASVEEIATYTGLPPALIQRFIDLELIVPRMPYTEVELRELRRARRLVDGLGIDVETVEVLLRMRRRILALQREVARLQADLRGPQAREPVGASIDAEWDDSR